jgi:hypothetical protein
MKLSLHIFPYELLVFLHSIVVRSLGSRRQYSWEGLLSGSTSFSTLRRSGGTLPLLALRLSGRRRRRR